MTETLTSRVFGALRPLAAPTGTAIIAALDVSAPNAHFIRNRRGWFVFERVTGLEAQEAASTVSEGPPLASISVTVSLRDPSNQFISRQAVVALPRDPSPTSAASLFTPIDVVLYPSPLAKVEPGWAVVRASVRDAGTGVGVPSAYLRVRRASSGGEVLGRGLADARGEAMVAVAGIPVVNWQSDPEASVLATDVDVVLEAFFDASQSSALPNPDLIETRLAALPQAATTLRLAPGREVTADIELAVA